MPQSQANIITVFRRVMSYYRQLQDWGGGSASGGNMITLQNNLTGDLESDFPDQIMSGAVGLRQQIAAAYDDPTPLLAQLQDWALLIGLDADTPLQQILDQWYGYCVTNSLDVAPRTMTYAVTPTAAGGNTGDGVIKRILVDARGFQRQGVHGSDTYTLRCIADAASEGATRNAEVFNIESLPAARDSLDTTSGSVGAGIDTTLTAVDPINSSQINNALLQTEGTSNGAPTSIIDWDSENGVSAGIYTWVSGTSYLPARDQFDTVGSLRATADDVLTQEIQGNLGADTAYYSALAYLSSGTGTLHLRVGAVSASATLSAGQADWQILELAPTGGSYYRQLASDPFKIGIEFDTIGTAVTVAPVWALEPYTEVGGTGWLARPGQTPFLAGSERDQTGDTFTATDVLPDETVIQRHLGRLLDGFYLPYAVSAGAATIAEPA